LVSRQSSSCADGATSLKGETKERQMNMKQLILAGCAVLALSVGTAQAGPCDTVGKPAMRDAGSGPTPGNTGQPATTGSADARQQPPTNTMNRATGGGPASSEDAQKQMQGRPTAAQQAQGAKPSGQMADQGC
jgi:hypothetical protein